MLLLSVERLIELLDDFEHFLEVASYLLGKVAEMLLVNELSLDRGIVLLELLDLCFIGSSLSDSALGSFESFSHLIERVNHRIRDGLLDQSIRNLGDFLGCLLAVRDLALDLMIILLLDLTVGGGTFGLSVLDKFFRLGVIVVKMGGIFLVR